MWTKAFNVSSPAGSLQHTVITSADTLNGNGTNRPDSDMRRRWTDVSGGGPLPRNAKGKKATPKHICRHPAKYILQEKKHAKFLIGFEKRRYCANFELGFCANHRSRGERIGKQNIRDSELKASEKWNI